MKKRWLIAVVAAAAALVATRGHAQGTSAPEPADCAKLEQDLFIDLKEVVQAGCTPSEAQIAKLLDNPVGNFVALPFQYDYVEVAGPKLGTPQTLHKFQLTPTFPLSLGRDWNLINRIVVPFFRAPINEGFGDCVGLAPASIASCSSFPDALADPFDPTVGLSDLVYVGLASPKKPIRLESTGGAFIWGVGVTTMFPTAADEVLGTGKYGVGPAGVVGYLGKRWTLGVFPQHWWSVGGDDERADVRLSNVQLFAYYTLPWDPEAQWRIGMSPNISIDWNAEGDRTTIPVGLGIGRIFQFGPLPVEIQVEADYSVIHPDDKPGSRWDLRLYFIPVIPTFMF